MAKKNNLTTRRNYHDFIIRKEQEDKQKRDIENQKRKTKEESKIAKMEESANKMDIESRSSTSAMDIDANPEQLRLKEFFNSKKIRKVSNKHVVETTHQKVLRKQIEKRKRKMEDSKLMGMDLDI